MELGLEHSSLFAVSMSAGRYVESTIVGLTGRRRGPSVLLAQPSDQFQDMARTSDRFFHSSERRLLISPAVQRVSHEQAEDLEVSAPVLSEGSLCCTAERRCLLKILYDRQAPSDNKRGGGAHEGVHRSFRAFRMVLVK